MFSQIQSDLRRLVQLTEEIATYDATLAAKPDIQPTEKSLEERRRKGAMKIRLMEKYELFKRT